MRYTQVDQGRIFVLSLENGDILHKEVEWFAREKNIAAGAVIAVGGADKNSELVVGPEDGTKIPIDPMKYVLDEVHEIAGTGTVFTDEEGNPVLHMHLASGRNDKTITGCTRNGVIVWKTMEVILFEFVNCSAKRVFDSESGYRLLRP